MMLNNGFWGLSSRVATLFVYLFTLVAPLTSLGLNLDSSDKVTASAEFNVMDSFIAKREDEFISSATSEALTASRAKADVKTAKFTSSKLATLQKKVELSAIQPLYQAPMVTLELIDQNVVDGIWGAHLVIEDDTDVDYVEILLWDEFGVYQKSLLISTAELLDSSTITCPYYAASNGMLSEGSCIAIGDNSNTEYKRNFDVSDLASGSYTATVYASDYEGNYSFTALSSPFSVDNSYRDFEAPVFSYFSPYAIDGAFLLSYDIEDEISKVAGANYEVRNSLGEVIQSGDIQATDIYYSSDPYFYVISPFYSRYFAANENPAFNQYGYYWIDSYIEVPAMAEEGSFEITVCATDSLGNSSTYESGLCASFEYVNIIPDVTALADPNVISPINQDGLADESIITFSINNTWATEYQTMVYIVNSDGELVDIVLDGTGFGEYYNGVAIWDGKDQYEAYVADGEYYYLVWVADEHYNYGYSTGTITVDNTKSDYKLELLTEQSTLPSPAYFTFKATAGEEVEFAWDLDGEGSFFDEVENGTESIQEYGYYASGDYKVGVRITDQVGNVEFLYITVTAIGDEPILKLTAQPGISVDEGTNVSIVAEIAGLNKPFGMVWSGDCDLNKLTDGSYTYDMGVLEIGTYTCNVVVTDQDGDTDNESITITVNNAVPTVTISIDPALPLEGDTVTLTANATGGNGSSDVYTYLWSGDCSGDKKNALLATLPVGDYTCTVLVTDVDGDSTEETINFSVAKNVPVVVIDQGAEVNFYEGFLLTLDAIVTGGNDPISYLWSGDCSGEMRSADFNAVELGTYSCTVTVTDADGDTDSFTTIINVLNYVPEVSLTVAPATPKEGDFVKIFSNVIGGNKDYTYLWSGDCSGNEADAELGYLLAGNYSCTLVVTDADGDTDTATVNFEVKDYIPVIKITANPGTTVEQGTAVKLTAEVTGGNLPYQTGVWGGSCTGNGNTFTLPTTAGTYVCSYSIKDADGDLASASITVTVKAPVVTPKPVDPKPIVKDETPIADEVLGEKDEEVVEEEKEDEDKADETCELNEISGVIYLDINKNGKQDKGEDGLADVKFELYFMQDGKKELVKELTTDKDGKWNTKGCYGKYILEIKDGLNDDYEVNDLDLSVNVDENTEISIPVEDTKDNKISPWIWVGLVLFVLAVGVAGYAISRRDEA